MPQDALHRVRIHSHFYVVWNHYYFQLKVSFFPTLGRVFIAIQNSTTCSFTSRSSIAELSKGRMALRIGSGPRKVTREQLWAIAYESGRSPSPANLRSTSPPTEFLFMVLLLWIYFVLWRIGFEWILYLQTFSNAVEHELQTQFKVATVYSIHNQSLSLCSTRLVPMYTTTKRRRLG